MDYIEEEEYAWSYGSCSESSEYDHKFDEGILTAAEVDAILDGCIQCQEQGN